ncbi:MAG TPA: MBL fold metallo-hydrolase [Methanobacterium sp.]|nr:MBL fold metallo-hydrolase [Methanobacterium sp.]
MKISDEVYTLDSTKGNYVYLILAEEIILIDTGLPKNGEGILNDLKSMDINPPDINRILITHDDMDHVGSLALLEKASGAKIWASKDDIPSILGDINRHVVKRILNYIIKLKKPKNINSYPEDGIIGDIEVVYTPGHTLGHVCLLYKDIMFVGDLFRTKNGEITMGPSFSNWNNSILKESIFKIDEYDFKWICPAHGEPIKRDSHLKDFIKKIE